MRRLAAFGLALLLVKLALIATSAAQPKPYVYATNYPLAYFAARISDDSFLVLYPEIPGEPSKWRPGRADLDDMRQAALVLVNGAGYEKWDATGAVAPERLIDTTAGLKLTLPERAGPARAPWQPPSAAPDPSVDTWLDLSVAVEQAAAIKKALLSAGLGNATALDRNFAALSGELFGLDRRLMQISGRREPVPVVAARPVYDYLARRYPLSIKSLDWPGRGIPSEAMILELESLLEEHPAKLMLWPELPDWPYRQRLEDIGLTLVVLPTLESWPGQGDFISVMTDNVDRLTGAVAETK